MLDGPQPKRERLKHSWAAFPLGPKGGFWPDDFFKKRSPLTNTTLVNNVPWWRRNKAQEGLMKDPA